MHGGKCVNDVHWYALPIAHFQWFLNIIVFGRQNTLRDANKKWKT